MVVPDRAKGHGAKLFQQRHAAKVIAFGLEGSQHLGGLEKRKQQGLDRGPDSRDPGAHPVHAGVEEVEGQVDPVEGARADDLQRDLSDRIIENHHVVAVPTNSARHVQKELGKKRKQGRDLVGHRLGRVKVAEVQARQQPLLHRVAQVELVRAHHE